VKKRDKENKFCHSSAFVHLDIEREQGRKKRRSGSVVGRREEG